MGSTKKKMVNKTFSRRLSSSKDTFTSILGEVMITEREQTTGISQRHPFLRTNAHSGPIPSTDSLRRAGPRRGNPQHFVVRHRGMVKQLWRGLQDPNAHRPTAKIAKSNSEQKTDLMHKCLNAHLHTTSYLARFLAKICKKFKSTAVSAYASTSSTTSTTLGTKISAQPPHPCINTDGQFLAPNRAPIPITLALHKDASEHVSSDATHNQTNNLSVVTGPNVLALSHKMPTPSSPVIVGKTAAPTWYLANPVMTAGPSETPSIRTPEKQIQNAKERPTAIAFLGKWKRVFAIKTVFSTAVITNKDHTHKHTTFKKWKLYTRLGIKTTNLNAHTVLTSLDETLCKWRRPPSAKNERHITKKLASLSMLGQVVIKKGKLYIRLGIATANLNAHTVRTSLAEALCRWRRLLSAKCERHITKKLACALTARLETQKKTTMFNEWCHHTHDTRAVHHFQVQLSLKGLASEIHTITVPYPVTRHHLHEVIVETTSIPPQEQHLGSMHNHTDAQNADLFYIEKSTTLQPLLHLNGGSGSSRPPSSGPHKHAKTLTHQTLKFHIFVNGPDQHHNALRVLPNDKIGQLKERLEERVDLPSSYQTLFLHGQQLDDDLRLDSSNPDEMNDNDDKSPIDGKAGAAAYPSS